MGWVTNGKGTPRLDMNLCGILPIPIRFAHLHARFCHLVEDLQERNPLQQALGQEIVKLGSFLQCLRDSAIWLSWKKGTLAKGTLSQYLKIEQRRVIRSMTQQEDQKLLSLTPLHSRLKKTLALADWSLSPTLTIKEQDLLYAYRRGKFAQGCYCACGIAWKRGHESCPILKCRVELSVAERKKKEGIKSRYRIKGVFTHVDYLLWTKQLQRAAVYIQELWQRLNQVFRDRCQEEQDEEEKLKLEIG